jgi:hypothetical protein
LNSPSTFASSFPEVSGRVAARKPDEELQDRPIRRRRQNASEFPLGLQPIIEIMSMLASSRTVEGRRLDGRYRVPRRPPTGFAATTGVSAGGSWTTLSVRLCLAGHQGIGMEREADCF